MEGDESLGNTGCVLCWIFCEHPLHELVHYDTIHVHVQPQRHITVHRVKPYRPRRWLVLWRHIWLASKRTTPVSIYPAHQKTKFRQRTISTVNVYLMKGDAHAYRSGGSGMSLWFLMKSLHQRSWSSGNAFSRTVRILHFQPGRAFITNLRTRISVRIMSVLHSEVPKTRLPLCCSPA
jgi:hypothetical protein